MSSGVGCNSYSNDASLLLPTNALTGNYRVFTYPSWNPGVFLPDYAAIIATTDGTMVTFTASCATQAGGPIGALGPGQSATFLMNAGDVIEIMGADGSQDISGSRIQATHPVQVIGGHPCRFIPDSTAACDHIEETILPIETLGTDYLVTAPQTPDGQRQYEVRVHGVEDGTTVTVDPPGPAGATFTLAAGQTVSFGIVSGDFHMSANKRFYVSQYMIGGSSFPNPMQDGDPSQSNGVPTAQYRTDYTFLAPSSYTTNMVNVTAPMGAMIVLDGAQVSGFTPIGSSGFGVARVPLSANQVHKIVGTVQFGIVVYGYGSYTSYMYPGGLNLQKL